MKVKEYHRTLQKMFPELEDSTPVEEWRHPSYNDGGSYVTTIWEGPGRHTQTVFNDWKVDHPDTSIQVVERYLKKEWKFRPITDRKTYSER